MNLQELYYYLFYKIYNSLNGLPITDMHRKVNAVSIIIFLELSIVFSYQNYKDVFLGYHIKDNIFSFSTLLPWIVILVINWIAFSKNDIWKTYESKFDAWPKEKNLKGGWIVFLVVTILVANFIISCILYSPLRPVNTMLLIPIMLNLQV